MEYKEGYYYEYLENNNKFYGIRYVGEENSRYVFKCLTDIRDYVNGVKLCEYGPLKITTASVKSERKKESNKNGLIFNSFLNDIFKSKNINEVKLNVKKNIEFLDDNKILKNITYKYFLSYNLNSINFQEIELKDDINNFFSNVENLLNIDLLEEQKIKLSQDQKDKFLIEQFS
mgnify:CR=1 FL=1